MTRTQIAPTRQGSPRAARTFWVLVLVAAAGLVSTGSAFAKGYMTVPFRYRKARPVKLLLLPPHAEFIKNKVIMTEEMVNESAALEVEATNALAAQLQQRGYKVRVLTTAEMRKTAGLQQLVTRVNDRYNEEWSKLVNRPRQVKKRRYSVGPDAVKLCTLFKADGLAVARVQAVGVSAGKAILSGIGNLGVPSHRSFARMDLSIIDSREGRVEAFFVDHEATSLKQLTRKPAKIMGQLAANVLDPYPASTFEDLEAARGAEVAEAKSDDSEGAEEADPIAEFEALMSPQQKARK